MARSPIGYPIGYLVFLCVFWKAPRKLYYPVGYVYFLCVFRESLGKLGFPVVCPLHKHWFCHNSTIDYVNRWSSHLIHLTSYFIGCITTGNSNCSVSLCIFLSVMEITQREVNRNTDTRNILTKEIEVWTP